VSGARKVGAEAAWACSRARAFGRRAEVSPARWWQSGIVYQIYPRSFADSDGDGVGDLEGIRARLDYLNWLGVDAIWISPFYPSPMADFGYDVSEFCDVDPLFGTLASFDALVRDAHARGLRVIVDYVPNHTSDRHPWFVEARGSRDNSKRDFYLWRDGNPGGGPPNNWLSEFGGPAWTWDAGTKQYYCHSYLAAQPDLNWRNPEVRAEMLDVLAFWLDRGVDGFRIDAIHHVIKDHQYRDNPPNPDYLPGQSPHQSLIRLYTTDRPEVHEVIADMRAVVDRYPDRVLIGEAYLPLSRLMSYYGVNLGGIHLPFNFHLIRAEWRAHTLSALAREYEGGLPEGAWPNWVLGNHDRSRIASRVGTAQARVAAMLLLTLRGTPTMYYGDELGMRDVLLPPDQVQDPWEKNVPGLGLGRDPERTPMQWSSAPHAGFSTVHPWLPVAEDFRTANVDGERSNPRSMLTFYRALIALRRRHPALSVGNYASLDLAEDVFSYRRDDGDDHVAVLLNLTSDARQLALPARLVGARPLLSTHPERASDHCGARIELAPDEGMVVAIK
jgi:alpha-glucosidase